MYERFYLVALAACSRVRGYLHYPQLSILVLFHVQVVGEIEDVVKTGLWVGDCFIYTNSGKFQTKNSPLLVNYQSITVEMWYL